MSETHRGNWIEIERERKCKYTDSQTNSLLEYSHTISRLYIDRYIEILNYLLMSDGAR